MAVETRRADDATLLDQQKVELNSPTNGGRSVGIVRLRTESHGVCKYKYIQYCKLYICR
jgi:hypothetical protein